MDEHSIVHKGSGYGGEPIHHEHHGGLNTHEQNFHVIGLAIRFAGFLLFASIVFLGIALCAAAYILAKVS